MVYCIRKEVIYMPKREITLEEFLEYAAKYLRDSQ